MITKVIATSTNLKSVLVAKSTYFIVKEEILLQGIQYVLGTGSVIEFAGGCFRGTFGTSLNLNGGQVIANPYPIFTNMQVYGFSNDRVYAEWFNDNNNTISHTYINKALRAAKGCPVILTRNKYVLKGSIVFPSGSPSTLIVNGVLEIDNKTNDASWNENPVAIDINTSEVNLDVNKIRFPDDDEVLKDEDGKDVLDNNGNPIKIKASKTGVAIRISGDVSHISINVNTIFFTERGIDISPANNGANTIVSYLNIKFQSICATYGIYIGLLNVLPIDVAKNNRLTRAVIYGGRLQGDYGVYVAQPSFYPVADFHNLPISEMSFANIGLESLTATPLLLRYATRLRFENIRMAEDLPETGSWLDLQDVSWLRFDIHGDFNADKIEARGTCSNVIIKGTFLQDTNWTNSPFDTLVIDATWVGAANDKSLASCKALTNSVQPFPMTNAITKNGDLQSIQPVVISPVADEYPGLRALPRILHFIGNSAAEINLDGLHDYAPCIYYFTVDVGKVLTFNSKAAEFYPSELNTDRMVIKDNGRKLQVNEAGLYKIMWFPVNGVAKMIVSFVR